jgi:integrase
MSQALKASDRRVQSEAKEPLQKRATSAKRRLTDTYVEGLTSRAAEYAVADAEVAGLVIRVLPSGRKSWAWRGSFGGSAVRRTLGTFPLLSCADARLAVVSLKLDYQPSSPTAKLGTHQPIGPTFETLAMRHLDSMKPYRKATTDEAYRRHYRASLEPAFASMRAGRIGPREVGEWFYEKKRTAPGGARRALSILRVILRWGNRQGLFGPNWNDPTLGLKLPPEGKPVCILTGDQLQRLGAVLRSKPICNYQGSQGIFLLLLTGCRPLEIFSARWSDLIADDKLRVDGKTGERIVYLGPEARRILKTLRDRQRYKGIVTPFIFPSPVDASKNQTQVAQLWARVRKEADLPPKTRLYDLRHSYASHCLMAGETLAATGSLLGHSSPKSTERYAHTADEVLLKASAVVARAIEAVRS